MREQIGDRHADDARDTIEEILARHFGLYLMTLTQILFSLKM